MHLPLNATPSRQAVLAFRFLVGVWITLTVLMCTRTALWPKRNSVYPIFADAGHGWLAGTDLYDQHFWELQIDQYRYSPLVAAFFVPFGLLPDRLGGVLWRLLNAGIFFGGVIAYYRAVFPGAGRFGLRGATVFGWLLIPLGISSLNNGQANPLVIGMILFALAAVERERWNWAAVALALPILFKVYPAAMALLLLLIYPRKLGWRLALLLTLGAILPFFLQDPAYVARQYSMWIDKLISEDRSTRAISDTYRDFWLLLRWANVPLPRSAYLPLQMTVAAGVAAVVLIGRARRWDRRELLHCLLGLGCAWMVVFGPATENSTFMLVAPTMACAVLEGFGLDRPVWTRCLLAAMVGLFVGSTIITALPDGRNWAYPLNPLGAVLLFAERLLRLGSATATQPSARGVLAARIEAA
jgi:hypothetical protein